MVLKDEFEEIVSNILEYNPPPEIDSWIAEKSDKCYDKVVKVFFMLRVLANIQLSLIRYFITIYGGKVRKDNDPNDIKIRKRLSFRRKNIEKIIEEVKKIQESMEEMTDDQRILYKKEHITDLEYVLDYYLSVVKKIEIDYARKFREYTRKKFSSDRWWNWFRFTELGKLWKS